LSRAIVGSPATVRAKLEAFIAETAADEIMMTSQIFDHAARLRSYEIVAGIRDGLQAPVEQRALSPA
jgi:alkanesulfonate monooxygenase SsuD/methylene tetrahydromethanopterin reductase-like flavin-dependent oxidoreductase (luciferase family)